MHDFHCALLSDMSDESCRPCEGNAVLSNVARRAARRGRERVAVNVDAFELLKEERVPPRSARADHRNARPCLTERLCLLPDSTIERDGQILDEDESPHQAMPT